MYAITIKSQFNVYLQQYAPRVADLQPFHDSRQTSVTAPTNRFGTATSLQHL